MPASLVFRLALALLAAPAAALRLSPMTAAPSAVARRAAPPAMAWEWFTEASGPQGQKFKDGKEFFFFQAPSAKTGYQEDLPNFFSKVRCRVSVSAPIAHARAQPCCSRLGRMQL
jgi:hypothetical protein